MVIPFASVGRITRGLLFGLVTCLMHKERRAQKELCAGGDTPHAAREALRAER
jgi:hypothetical protein